MHAKQLISQIAAPLRLLVFVLVLLVLSRLNIIPTPEEIVPLLDEWFVQYGVGLIAVFAFIENIVGINMYFPGSLIIVTAMSLTAGDPKRALLTFFAILLSGILAHLLNYVLGRYVLSTPEETRLESQVKKPSVVKTWLWFASTLWHPQMASITTTACGTSNMPFREFTKYFFPVGIAWNILWGVVLYNIGGVTNIVANAFPLFILYLVAWIVRDIFRYVKSSRLRTFQ